MAGEPQYNLANTPDWMRERLERQAANPSLAVAEAEREKARALERMQNTAKEIEELRTKTEETKLKQEDRRLEIEKVKRGKENTPRLADPDSIRLEFAMGDNDEETKLDFLVEPFLPRASVVGFYGRGETAKSSFLATMAADISSWASTLWISTEENEARIRRRHTKGIPLEGGSIASLGQKGTLQAVTAVVLKADAQGHALTSDFNTYEHLEPAIALAKIKLLNLPAEHQPAKPLRLVVLDTVTALTTWTGNAGTNSDEGVKRLLSYLRGVAERHDVTIALVGHSNKGKHDHFADSVMGATAWVNSPRISFLHAKDLVTDGQVIVRVAKANEIPHMAQLFSVHMVHELHQFADGPKAGLMKVMPRARVWGGRDAEELWQEVTTVQRDEDEGGFTDKRKRTVADIVRDKLVEMVRAGTEPHITREQVECQLPDVKVNRAQWTKVDMDLRQFELWHKVEVATAQRTIIYRAIPDTVPK